MEQVAALVFAAEEQKETTDIDHRGPHFITRIPNDMKIDGARAMITTEDSELEDLDGILEETEGENILSSIFQSTENKLLLS